MDKPKVIGVIYQNLSELAKFKAMMLRDEHRKITVGYRWIVETTVLNPLKSLDVVIKEVYSFHQVTDKRSALNTQGLTFYTFMFLDGVYDTETLNYLQSRIKQ